MAHRARFLVALLALLAISLSWPLAAQTQRSAAKPAAAQPSGMTNSDVIKMVSAGLSESLVVAAIKQAKAHAFDLSADGLVALKKAGVPDRVIALMLNPNAPVVDTAPATSTPPAAERPKALPSSKASEDHSDLLKPHESGIYAFTSGNLVQLDESVVAHTGIGGKDAALSALTFGVRRLNVKAEARGSRANLRLSDDTNFYFYGSSFNPKEFVLVRLQSDDRSRTIVVAQGGAFRGVKSGFQDEDLVTLKINKADNGIYKVVPSKGLKQGEYAFVNTADEKSRKFWDFGVDKD